MKIQIENVPKDQRDYFKHGIYSAIKCNGNVYCMIDKAIIEIKEPYIATEESLKEKSANKKAIDKFIYEFRQYQFNQ